MAFVHEVETSVIISSIMFGQEIFLHLWNSFILSAIGTETLHFLRHRKCGNFLMLFRFINRFIKCKLLKKTQC